MHAAGVVVAPLLPRMRFLPGRASEILFFLSENGANSLSREVRRARVMAAAEPPWGARCGSFT